MKHLVCILIWFIGLPVRLLILSATLLISSFVIPIILFYELDEWACKGKKWNYNPFIFYKRLFYDMLIKNKIIYFLDYALGYDNN